MALVLYAPAVAIRLQAAKEFVVLRNDELPTEFRCNGTF